MSDPDHALDRPRKKVEQIGLESTSTSPTEDDTAIDLVSVWNTLKRSKWLILATCILITAAAAGYTWTLPKVYEATSIVSVENNENRSNAGGAPQAVQAAFGGTPALETEIGILQNSGELSRSIVSTLRQIDDTTNGVQFTLFEPEEGETSVDQQTAVERLHEMVQFEGDEEQGMIEITVQSKSPEEAAFVANVYSEEYRSFSQEKSRESVVAARKFLEKQLEKRKQEIREIESEWESFAQNNAVATRGEDGQRVAQEYVELQSKRDALRFQLEQERQTLNMLQQKLDQAQPNELRSKVMGEQKIQSLRTQIQAMEEKISTLKAEAEQFYINNPDLRGNEEKVPELAELKRRINGFEKRKSVLTDSLVAVTSASDAGAAMAGETSTLGQMGTLRDQIENQKMTISQLESQIQALEERIAEYDSKLGQIPQQTVRRQQLERRLKQAEKFYQDVANELQKTIIAEESELGYVKVMRTASVPMMPVSPDIQQNILLGLLLGLGLGLGGAFVRESMNWQIYEPDDIQDEGYSLVGVVPAMDREIKKSFEGDAMIEVEGNQLSTDLLPLLNPWSPITENYRLIRANLQHAGAKNGTKETPEVMMVTSPEAGDGKTTTSANLALTIALSGRKVLLIDGDLRRPNAHRLLGHERSPGLAEVLANGEGEEVVRRTLIDDLFFLPAGTPEVPPTELLDSVHLRELLSKSRERFDAIIIDTPPVLLASDPLVIGPECDATLVVASADKTDFRALDQTQSTLGAVGVPISGVVFNRYDNKKSSGHKYGYGYGYDSTYDYAHEA